MGSGFLVEATLELERGETDPGKTKESKQRRSPQNGRNTAPHSTTLTPMASVASPGKAAVTQAQLHSSTEGHFSTAAFTRTSAESGKSRTSP